MIDVTVGIIIGAAFGRIVNSVVNDGIMPPIGLVMGHADFSSLFINLSETHYDSLANARKAGYDLFQLQQTGRVRGFKNWSPA